MMVYAMYLSMRIKMQQIEPDDVMVSHVTYSLMSHDSL